MCQCRHHCIWIHAPLPHALLESSTPRSILCRVYWPQLLWKVRLLLSSYISHFQFRMYFFSSLPQLLNGSSASNTRPSRVPSSTPPAQPPLASAAVRWLTRTAPASTYRYIRLPYIYSPVQSFASIGTFVYRLWTCYVSSPCIHGIAAHLCAVVTCQLWTTPSGSEWKVSNLRVTLQSNTKVIPSSRPQWIVRCFS